MEYKNYFEKYELFFYYTDVTSESQIEKVLVNEKNIFEFYESFSHHKKVISLYGDYLEIEKFFELKFKIKVSLKIENHPVVLYGIIIDDTIFLVLACQSIKFFIKKPLKKESLLILMKKYLQDISEHILIIPNQEILQNWTTENTSPFDEEVSFIRKIMISEKVQEKLIIKDFSIQYENVNDILLSINNFSLKNNFSQNIYLEKIYNNRENHENSSRIFFNFMMRNLLRTSKLKNSEMIEEANKNNLVFSSTELNFFSDQIDEFHQKFISIFYDLKKKFNDEYNKILNELCSGIIGWNYINLVKNQEKLEEIFHTLFKKEFDKIIFFDLYKIEVNLNEYEFINFSKSYMSKLSNIVQNEKRNDFCNEFYKSFIYRKNKFLDIFIPFKSKISNCLNHTYTKLTDFHLEYINKSSFYDCIEINKISANPIRNDLTGITSLNLIEISNKFKFDETTINEKIFKGKKIERIFNKIELVHIFPTINTNNYIIVFLEDDNTSKFYHFCFCFSQNIKKLFTLNSKKNKFFINYFPEIETLSIFNTQSNYIHQYKISKYGYKEDLSLLEVKFDKIIEIDDFIYLQSVQKYIFLNEGILYEIIIYKNNSTNLHKCSSQKIIYGKSFPNQIKDHKYNKIIYSGSGDFFALQNSSKLDFYDINYLFHHENSIDVKNCSVKLFTDNKDSYIIIYNGIKKIMTAKILEGCESNYNILEDEKKKVEIKGNPILDYITSGFIKYGSKAEIIKLKYYFYLPEEVTYDILQKHIKEYSINLFKGYPVCFEIIRNLDTELDEILTKIDYEENEMNIMKMILISRVPIQICTIENDNIIPLNDGKRILISENFIKMKKIEEKAKYLSFGYIEKLLKDIKEDLFLVCIIGRQSSGKSYLLNKIFGTRFAVADTRCTDGIWVSYSIIDNHHFLVFDCEGLFSRQRKEIEEIKLLTLLAALSDFTYLNQDLTFNRHLNDLLNNLDKSVDRLKVDKLFKGKLIWTVRDVANSEKEGAYNEFKGYLNSFQKSGMNFIDKLFGGNIDFISLNNYQNLSFSKEINQLRKEAIANKIENQQKNSIHWRNGEELLKFLKINLVQLYTDDDSNADEIADQFYLNDLNEKLQEIWKTFSTEKNYEFEFKYISDNSKTYTSKFNLDKIPLQQTSENYISLDSLLCVFKEGFSDFLKDKNLSIIHNNFYENFVNFINVFKEYRLNSINSIIDREINLIFKKDKVSKYIQDIKNQFSNLMSSLNICMKKCANCFLLCSLLKNHNLIHEELYNKKSYELEKLLVENQEIGEIDILNKKKLENENKLLKNSYELEKQAYNIFSDWYNKKNQLDENQINYDSYNSIVYNNKNEIAELNRINQYYKYINDELCFEEEFLDLNLKYGYLSNKFSNYFETQNYIIDNINIKIFQAELKNVFKRGSEINSANDEKLNILINDLNSNYIKGISMIDEINKITYDINLNENELKKIQEIKSKTESLYEEEQDKLDNLKKLRDSLNFKLEGLENDHKEKQSEKESILNYSETFNIIKESIDKTNRIVNYYIALKIFEIQIDSLIVKINSYNENKININKKIIELKNLILENSTSKIKQEIEELESKLSVSKSIGKKKLEERKIKLISDLDNVIIDVNNNIITNKDHKEYLKILETNENELKILSEKKSILDNKFKKIENFKIIIIKFIDDETSKRIERFVINLFETDLINEKLLNEEYFDNFNIYDTSILNENMLEDYSYIKTIIEKKFTENLEYDIVNIFENEINISKETVKNLKIQIEEIIEKINLLTNVVENLNKEYEEYEKKESELESNLKKKSNELKDKKILMEEIKSISLNIQNSISICENNKNSFVEFKNKFNLVNEQIFKISDDFEKLEKAKDKYLELEKENNDLIEKISIIENNTKEINLEFKNSGKIIDDYNHKKHEKLKESLELLYNKIKKKDLDIESLNVKSSLLDERKILQTEIEKLKEKIKNSCDCQTNHKCYMYCKICPNKLCVSPAGHNSSHFCETKNHRCNIVCDTKNCKNICQLDADHLGEHKCKNDHICKEICKACSNQCKFSIEINHTDHICCSITCPKKCIICKKSCVFKDHFHDLKTEEITFKGIRTRLHLCEDEHECYEKCNYLGTCGIEYNEKLKQFESSFGENFSYTYLKPKIYFKKCIIKINKGKYKHEGYHKCDNALINQHRCDFQCPDCRSICREYYKHEKLHNFNHRNKEYCYFTNKSGENIIIEDDKGLRKYKVKDKAIAEDCYSSCKRRGRGHIHLIKCNGDNCLEKKITNAKHSNTKYYGFEKNKYDELNCKDFWNFYNINNPIGTKADEFSKCNFICSLCETDDIKVFCSDIVLHSNELDRKEHVFDCPCNEKKIYKGIDICFCIDITGSMTPYITNTKETIKKIISTTKNKIEKLKSSIDTLRISVVGYRDHCDKNLLETMNFSSYVNAEKFLENLIAEGGGDAPEAVVDGLDKALNMTWSNSTNEKILFLILDAPPHGTSYHDLGNENDNYPTGCKCGIDIDIILKGLFKKNIRLYVLKIGNILNKMENHFKKTNENIKFIPIEGADLTSLLTFQDAITNIVCKAIQDKEYTITD